MTPICGAPRRNGQPCQWRSSVCPYHGRQPAPPAALPSIPAPAGLEGHDLPRLAWWLMEQTFDPETDLRRTAVQVTLARLLLQLGQHPQDAATALREAALRGRVMHGLPPRPAEWPLAESLFDAPALQEFRRWSEPPGA